MRESRAAECVLSGKRLERPFVPPHRSVRRIQLTRNRLVLMSASGAGLSLLIILFGYWLLRFHEWLCVVILGMAGVPIQGSSLLNVMPGYEPIGVPIVNIPGFTFVWPAVIGTAGASIAILAFLHWRYPLGRAFLAFLIALISVAGAVAILNPKFSIGSDGFTTLWLRTQFVLWLALPFISAFLVLPIEPSALRGLGWMLLIGGYAFVWSSIRLAFCLGVLHHTGVAFLTALWCAIGPLCDLLYVLVFYSLAVRSATKRLWGKRQCTC